MLITFSADKLKKIVAGDINLLKEKSIMRFKKSLDHKIYKEIIANSDKIFRENFKKNSLKHAFGFRDPHKSLNFFVSVEAFDNISLLVRHRLSELNGRNYKTLRRTAEAILSTDPLSATILYRLMINSSLGFGKSKCYQKSAEDLLICNLLSHRITNWESYEEHELYFNNLKLEHKYKVGFWNKYEFLLEKQKFRNRQKLFV